MNRKNAHNAVLWLIAHDRATRELSGDLAMGATDADREVMRRSRARGDRRKVDRQ